MTKMILVAALTNDRGKGGIVWVGEGGKVDRVQEVVETEGDWNSCGLLCMNTKPRTVHHQSPGGERCGKKKC